MKKLSTLILAAAGLTLASCSNEEFVNPSVKGDGNFNVTVQLPGAFGTRNTNDGLTATKLFVGIFDADNDNVYVAAAAANDFDPSSLTTNVSMNLATGKSYTIAFFAYAPGQFTSTVDGNATTPTLYTFNQTTGNMVVDYSLMNQTGMNSDSYDCFFKVISTGVIGTDTYESNVLLTRPIAQINWGTNDFAEPTISDANAFGTNLQYATPSLTTDAYNTFSFVNGDVDGEKVGVELNGFTAPTDFQYPNVPGSKITNNVNTTYKYVGMQYLLAPVATSATYDLTLNVSNAANTNATTIQNDIVVSAAPVQANYQTNIYGALLTDNYNFTVTKSAAWAGSYLAPQVEGEQVTGDNGQAVDGLYYDAASKTYTITSTTGLEYYSVSIAATSGQQGLVGTTVLLGDDLDMTSVTHTPINNAGATFDGQGHTISNLTVTAKNGDSAGFFSNAIGKVQNINFTNATITGNYKAGVLAADGMASIINNINVDGAKVTSTPWFNTTKNAYDDANNVGGIVGYLSAESNGTVSNCSVSNATITAYRKVGGIVGYANGACKVFGNTATNVNVIANQQINGNYAGAYPYLAGAIVGGTSGTATVENNTENDVNVVEVNGNGEFVADNLDQLQAITNLTFDNTFVLQGKTILFGTPDAEMDLGGATIDPIALKFSGDAACTIDFQNVTLKNFTVANNGSSIGLIGSFDGKILNLNVENMTINTATNNAGLVGYFTGSMENVKLTGCTFTSTGDNLGALVGNAASGTFTNCTVDGCEISGKVNYGMGGIVGTITENHTFTFSTVAVTNTTITSTGSATGSSTGILVGNNLAGAPLVYSNITVTGSTVNGEAAVAPTNN